MTMRKHSWILLLLLACLITGCGGGGGSSGIGIEPSENDYIIEALLEVSGDSYVTHWTTIPIPVYMDTTNVPNHWKPEHATFFQEACTQWTTAAQGKFSFIFLSSPTDPCISVRWVDDEPFGEQPPTIGVTRMTVVSIGGQKFFTTANEPIRVEMELAVHSGSGQPLSDNIMRLLSLHELGHAIGLWGHSDDPNDLMYEFLGTQSGLSARDIATINRLYDLDAQIYQMPESKRGLTPEEIITITMP